MCNDKEHNRGKWKQLFTAMSFSLWGAVHHLDLNLTPDLEPSLG